MLIWSVANALGLKYLEGSVNGFTMYTGATGVFFLYMLTVIYQDNMKTLQLVTAHLQQQAAHTM